jgi:hypothetical protein
MRHFDEGPRLFVINFNSPPGNRSPADPSNYYQLLYARNVDLLNHVLARTLHSSAFVV